MTIARWQIHVSGTLLVLGGLILGTAQQVWAQSQTRWYFAEGATGPTFELDLILANPTASAAQVRITFLRGSGTPHIVTQDLPATSRKTIRVNAIPGLETEGTLSMLVESLNGVPIAAERTMYWIGTTKRGGHNAAGVEAPQTTWYLAEGATGSFFSTYILIANPNAESATVAVRYLKDDGSVVDQAHTIEGNRRFTISVNNDVPGMSSANFGARITSTRPVLVERAMYWQSFEGGTAAVAVSAPSTTWMFAEGHAGSDFQTFFLLSNPNPTATAATVTFYLESGAPVTKPYDLAANSRSTVYVNQMPEMVGLSFATMVTSALPIVAERAMYWGGFIEGHATPGLTQSATKWALPEGRVGTHEGQPFDTFYLLLNNSSSPLNVRGTFYLEDGTGSTYDFVIPANSRYTLYAGVPPRMAGQAMAAFFEANAPFIAERATYWGTGWFGGHGSTGVPWSGPIVAPPTQPRAATPTFSLASRTYSQELNVTLSTTTAGAIIHYTMDGSEPTAASQQYLGNIPINETTTLKAKAFATGYEASYTATAVYTLQPLPPVLQHPSGSYPAPMEFGITTNVPGAVIRYTTDGSTPNDFSAVYAGPIPVTTSQTLTLSARVFKFGWTPSETVRATYQVSQGLLQTPTPEPAAGVYFEGQTVTLSAQPFVLIRYTTDGSEPTESSPFYSGAFTVTTPLTLKARAFNTGYSPSNVLTARYDLKVRTPSISPATGVIMGSGTNASASTPTQGVTFRYTLDMTEPTESSPQLLGGVFVAAEQTIVVRAFKSAWVTSDEGFATYTSAAPPVSSGTFTLSGVDLTEFNRTNSSLSFNLTGAGLDTSSVVVFRNGSQATSSAIVQPAALVGSDVVSAITLPGLIDGRNDFEVYATDVDQLQVFTHATVWAGNRTATIRVMSPSGPLTGAQVQFTLLADEAMVQTGTTNANGVISVPFLPTSERFRVDASATDYRARTAQLGPGVTDLTITLPVDNLRFDFGTQGWTGPVGAMVHSEPTPPLVPCPGCPVRENGTQAAAVAVSPEDTEAVAILSSTDLDVQIHTSQTPGAVGAYRFTSAAGVRVVRVRYRVQTAEPQSWPDSYTISLRSITTGRTVIDQRTVSQLYAAGALDANQATGWMTLPLTLDNDREEVELQIAVTNHADVVNDTALWVDSIREEVYEVSAFDLHDYKNSTHTHPRAAGTQRIEFLSAAPHTYYGGRTRVNGTIAIRAPQGARVTDVRLEVYYHGDRIALANLVDALRPVLLQTVGANGVIALTDSRLMFDIDATQFNALSSLTEANLNAQVVVTFASGHTAVRPLGRDLIALARYTPNNRYPPLDVGDCVLRPADPPFPCGGDDWARPLTVRFIGSVGDGLTWGDFSNMNGGPFPPHSLHQLGIDIDGYFNGYERRNATVAERIIRHLNQYGRKIRLVYVSHTRSDTDLFYQAIRNVTLDDGRAATEVIRPAGGHASHFHWQLDLSRLP